jgi:hypothetical protein
MWAAVKMIRSILNRGLKGGITRVCPAGIYEAGHYVLGVAQRPSKHPGCFAQPTGCLSALKWLEGSSVSVMAATAIELVLKPRVHSMLDRKIAIVIAEPSLGHVRDFDTPRQQQKRATSKLLAALRYLRKAPT